MSADSYNLEEENVYIIDGLKDSFEKLGVKWATELKLNKNKYAKFMNKKFSNEFKKILQKEIV